MAQGRRISETLRMVAPHLDIIIEAKALDALEEVETRGLRAAPGAAELLRLLPRERWGIVTSGSRPVATLRLGAAAIAPPDVFVTAADVLRGKPAPDGYLTAAASLGAPPAECVVIEDSPPGIAAGKAAGMYVIAVATTYPPAALTAADTCVPGLRDVRVESSATGVVLDARAS